MSRSRLSALFQPSNAPQTGQPDTLVLYNPKNAGFVSGESHELILRPNRKRGLVRASILLGLIMLVLITAGAIGQAHLQYLFNYDVHTTALVTDRQAQGGRSASYSIDYRFEVTDGSGTAQTYTGSAYVDSDTWSQDTPSSTITIMYDPRDPTQSTPMQGNVIWTYYSGALAIGGLVFLPALLLVLGLAIREMRRDRYFARHGQIVTGIISDAHYDLSYTPRNSKYHDVRVTYKFTDPLNGQEILQTKRFSSSLQETDFRFKNGRSVAVAFVDASHFELI